MEILSLDKLNNQKILALHNSITQPPMYISLESYQFDSKAKTVFYVIEVGILHSNSIHIHKIITRYSILYDLHQKIYPVLKVNNEIIHFPAKKIFRKNNENFIKKRASNLQDYFNQLTKNPFIRKSKDFREFFGLDTMANN